jgi:hypothetical protein
LNYTPKISGRIFWMGDHRYRGACDTPQMQFSMLCRAWGN